MSKLIGLACAVVLLIFAAKPQADQFSKYRAVQAYEIRPGILMMPRYSADGQVCEIGLERRHYSPEVIRLESTLSRKEIDEIADELAPVGERGAEEAGVRHDLISLAGSGISTVTIYENISIEVYSRVLATSKKHEIVTDSIAAAIKWKNRKCQ